MKQARRWTRVTNQENIPLREGRCVTVGGREIAIFNLGDHFLSIDNRCPHSGGPLCDGIVSGANVVCPLHGWKVSLETGETVRPGGTERRVETFPTRVDSGIVMLELPCHAEPDDNADAPAEMGDGVDARYHSPCACTD